MRFNIFLIIITLTLFSCSAQERIKESTNGIVYILPASVQKLLNEKIQSSKNDSIYFSLSSYSLNHYQIYMETYDKEDRTIYWITNTNREVFLNGKFYPIIFRFDETFANIKSKQEFLNSFDEENSYEITKINRIRDWGYHIDFTSDGKILYEGY